MSVLTIERLRRQGQELMEEVAREHYRAHAGLQPEIRLQPIYHRHRDVVGDEALALVRDAFLASAEGSDERSSARMLLEWQAEMLAHRELAALDEREVAWESAAAARLEDGAGIPYRRIGIEIANTAGRREREALERARARLVSDELAPLRRERFGRERELMHCVGVSERAVPAFCALSGIDLPALGEECAGFLSDTDAMWRDVLPEVIRNRLGIDPREATRADAVAVLRAPRFDPGFPPGGAESAARRHFADCGVSVDAGGRIIHDTGEREGKRARAFCAALRIPEEVHLVLRPHGGHADWRTYMHELGHALHFAYVSPELVFEHRWLGDNSITEGYAMLLDHLLQDRGWLRRHASLGRPVLADFLRAAGFEELHFLRRYSAKLLYELRLYDENVPLESLPGLFAELLTEATGFRYDPADAFVDVDPRFYSARYLRAWQLQAVLSAVLVERFDEDWYRNPRAGPWLIEQLFSCGQSETGDALAMRVTGRPLSFAPLIERIGALLNAT